MAWMAGSGRGWTAQAATPARRGARGWMALVAGSGGAGQRKQPPRRGVGLDGARGRPGVDRARSENVEDPMFRSLPRRLLALGLPLAMVALACAPSAGQPAPTSKPAAGASG